MDGDFVYIYSAIFNYLENLFIVHRTSGGSLMYHYAKWTAQRVSDGSPFRNHCTDRSHLSQLLAAGRAV